MLSFLWRYALFAALGFAAMALPGFHERFEPAAARGLALLSGWFSGRQQDVHGVFLRTGPDSFFVEVAPECLGLEVFITFIAAVLAFPAAARQRGVGIGLGLGLVLLVNPLRIASLYQLGLYSYDWAVWAHDWAWDAALFGAELAMFLMWVLWTQRAGRSAASDDPFPAQRGV